MNNLRWTAILLVFVCLGVTLIGPGSAMAATAEEIDRDVKNALETLYAKSPTAVALGEKAKGILVFPSIVKGGFLVGGQYGQGALLVNGNTAGYYSTVQVSYGLQAGLQRYGYALFFMSDSAMQYLHKSDGWELGAGPSIVVVDLGAASSLSTTTLQSNVYAFFFNQKGLMAGLGLAGTKVTEIYK